MEVRYPGVAVVIPARDEAPTIAAVVTRFAAALPGAQIHVCDNGSTDGTAERAAAAGATVHHEPRPGKGWAVRRLFADVEAEVYVLADGDDTHHAEEAPRMVRRLLDESLDMVVGERVAPEGTTVRFGHQTGNQVFSMALSRLFGVAFRDVFSGYRVFTKRFVRSFPGRSTGFEIESELAVHAASLGVSYVEVPTTCPDRPDGSEPKLSTLGDGFRIARSMGKLYREHHPFRALGLAAAMCVVLGVALAVPVTIDLIHTGLVPRFPSAFTVVGLFTMAVVLLTGGLVLESGSLTRWEQKRQTFLAVGRPPSGVITTVGEAQMDAPRPHSATDGTAIG